MGDRVNFRDCRIWGEECMGKKTIHVNILETLSHVQSIVVDLL